MDRKIFVAGIIAGAVTFVAANAQAVTPVSGSVSGDEKCYGVVRAGMNDCANIAGTHGCHAKAAVDGDSGEYIMLPKGLCEKLVNGSLTGKPMPEPAAAPEEKQPEDAGKKS
jgi:uncharacterized membrane protein